MPNASCTFQITPPLIIINRKITFERTILWASLYPRLVWGFPPSSAAWWANASDFAQSASWEKYFDCFGVWDLPNTSDGKFFYICWFVEVKQWHFLTLFFHFCTFCTFLVFSFRFSASPFSWVHFLRRPLSCPLQFSQRPLALRQTLRWFDQHDRIFPVLLFWNANLLGL